MPSNCLNAKRNKYSTAAFSKGRIFTVIEFSEMAELSEARMSRQHK